MHRRAVGLVRRGAKRAAVAVGLAIALLVPAYPGTAPAGAQQAAPGAEQAAPGVHVLGWGFSGVNAMVVAGPYLFVADTSGTVTELDAKTRDLVRVINGPAYHFDNPFAMVAYGGDVFVDNAGTEMDFQPSAKDLGSVTELDAATGALVRVIDGPAYRFDEPLGMAAWGHDLFVADPLGSRFAGRVTELDMATGKLVRVLQGPAYHFAAPAALAVSGRDLFVDNAIGNGSVSEVDASDGAVVRVLDNIQSTASSLDPALAVSGRYLFVYSSDYDSVQQVDISTGKVVRQLSWAAQYPTNSVTLAASGPYMFLSRGSSVSQLDIADGKVVRTFPGARYGFTDPLSLAVGRGDLYIGGLDSVAEVDVRSGVLIGATKGSRYDFERPALMTTAGPYLFVMSNGRGGGTGNSWVTELDTTTGALVRVVPSSVIRADNPNALAATGRYLFVSYGGDPVGLNPDRPLNTGSVEAVDTATGRVAWYGGLAGNGPSTPDPVYQPDALAVIGDHLFVANAGNNTVAEFDISTGSTVKIFFGKPYGFQEPLALAVAGRELLVSNGQGGYHGRGFVTELDTVTGDVTRTFSGPAYGLGELVVEGNDLYAATANGDLSITDLSTGALVKTIVVGKDYGYGFAISNGYLFVMDWAHSYVSKVDLSTGKLVSTLSGPAYQFANPQDIAVIGNEVFVANAGASTVTELPA